MDESGSQIQVNTDDDCVYILDDNPSCESGGGRDFSNFSDSGFFGISKTELSLAFLGDENSSESAFRDLEEFNFTSLDYISNPRTGRKKATPGIINAEDFDEGPQRQAFEIIRAHAMAYCGKAKVSANERLMSIEWLFNPSYNAEISFNLCCRVLDARMDVIRLRLNYELWRSWVLFPTSFPFQTTALPEFIAGEIFYCTDLIGREIAQEAWIKPGISTEEMLCNASGCNHLADVPNTYLNALHLLEDRYILSVNHDNWYLTGRNPAMHSLKLNQIRGKEFSYGGSMSWSKLF